MPTVETTFSTMPGTGAAIGSASGHALIVDRPEDVAGGQGLGFKYPTLAMTYGARLTGCGRWGRGVCSVRRPSA